MDFDVIVPQAADNGVAWTRPDLAFFNGTSVFMYPEGRPLNFASARRGDTVMS